MSGVDAVRIAVLANRLDTIVREMENTLLRAGRSAIINMARDFSCALITADNRLLSSAEGLPVHIIGTELNGQAMCELHDDIAEGDAYLHNDPYLGNTHPADHTILVPVFVDGEHLFTAAAKAHQADIGNANPTTYMPYAVDSYAEGALILPATRIQRGYADVEDVIRMCRRQIRVPDQWYGDYLAMLGSARIAERRLKELCARYGVKALKEFVELWFDYSERTMEAAIRRMPAGTLVGTGMHDPLPPVLPDGVPVNVRVVVDPDAGMIDLDLRDNIDCVPLGINQSQACATNNVITGLLNSIGAEVPHNAGTFRRIRVLLRENCIVGIPRFPASCSVATTNIGERLVATTQRTLADHLDGFGLAEGGCGIGAGYAVISGVDDRRDAEPEPYVNQVVLGSQGGPGGPRFDGWVTFGNSVCLGLAFRDSVEMDEQKYPIRVRQIRMREDSEGAGRRRGAPGAVVEFGPRSTPMRAAYVTDNHSTPPRGARGGGDGARSIPYKIAVDGSQEPLAPIGEVEVRPGELLGHAMSGGGGYGSPLEREPELVRADVLSRWISLERAREVYGVIFNGETRDESLEVDQAATTRARANPL